MTTSDGGEFARLLVRHNRALFRYIMTFLPRPGDAEEVLQRAATVLWQKFDEYDRERDFLPWALRVTYFEVLNYRKEFARSRLVFRPDVMQLLDVTRAEEEPMLDAQRAALRECLTHLDDDGRMLLKRRYCDSETVASLAKELRRTAKSLYRRLDRLREQIANCVQQKVAAETR